MQNCSNFFYTMYIMACHFFLIKISANHVKNSFWPGQSSYNLDTVYCNFKLKLEKFLTGIIIYFVT